MRDISYEVLKNGVDAASQRQKIISSNIANINTPGFKAKRVSFEKELSKALDRQGTMVKTHERHLGVEDAHKVTGRVIETRGHTMNENGNSVDIDREMVDLAANEIYYSALIEQVNRKLQNMSYVINR